MLRKISFILPFPGVLRAFSEGLPVRELRTQSRNEEAQREVGGSSPGIFDFAARIRSRILPETGTNFVTSFVTSLVANFFSPFFPAPKNPREIHATFGAKIHANFGSFFPSDFSGCSTLVCVAAFGCQYFYADQRRLVS